MTPPRATAAAIAGKFLSVCEMITRVSAHLCHFRGLSRLNSITQAVANRHNLCAQLRMIDKVAIEIAQSFSRSALISGPDFTRDLAAPQKVVANHHSSGTQFWQSQIQIAPVFFFHRVDKKQIESVI